MSQSYLEAVVTATAFLGPARLATPAPAFTLPALHSASSPDACAPLATSALSGGSTFFSFTDPRAAFAKINGAPVPLTSSLSALLPTAAAAALPKAVAKERAEAARSLEAGTERLQTAVAFPLLPHQQAASGTPSVGSAAALFGVSKSDVLFPLLNAAHVVSLTMEGPSSEGTPAPLTCAPRRCIAVTSGGDVICAEAFASLSNSTSVDVAADEANDPSSSAAALATSSHVPSVLRFRNILCATNAVRSALSAAGVPDWPSIASCSGEAATEAVEFTFTGGVAVYAVRSGGGPARGLADAWAVIGDFRDGTCSGRWAAARLQSTSAHFGWAAREGAESVGVGSANAPDGDSVLAVAVDPSNGIVTVAACSVGAALPLPMAAESLAADGSPLPLRVALDTLSPITGAVASLSAPSSSQQQKGLSALVLDVNVLVLSGAGMVGLFGGYGGQAPHLSSVMSSHSGNALHHRHFAWQSAPFAAGALCPSDSPLSSLCLVDGTARAALAIALRETTTPTAVPPAAAPGGHQQQQYRTLIAQTLLPHPLALLASAAPRPPPLFTVIAGATQLPAPRPLVSLRHVFSNAGGGGGGGSTPFSSGFGTPSSSASPTSLANIAVVAVGAEVSSVAMARAFGCEAVSIAPPRGGSAAPHMPQEAPLIARRSLTGGRKSDPPMAFAAPPTRVRVAPCAADDLTSTVSAVITKGGAIAVVSWPSAVLFGNSGHHKKASGGNSTPLAFEGAASVHLRLAHAAVASSLRCDRIRLRQEASGSGGGSSGRGGEEVLVAQEAVSDFFAALPLMKRLIASFIVRPPHSDEPSRVTAAMVATGCALWEQRGRLAGLSPPFVSKTSAASLAALPPAAQSVPAPSFYFQFLLGSLTAIRYADELAAVVAGLSPLASLWASASAADAEALWPIVRAVHAWQRRLLGGVGGSHASDDANANVVGASHLLPYLDAIFLALFRQYHREGTADATSCEEAEASIVSAHSAAPAATQRLLGAAMLGGGGEGSTDTDAAAPSEAPPILITPQDPLASFSSDPNEALLMYLARFGGNVPFMDLIVGTGAGDSPLGQQTSSASSKSRRGPQQQGTAGSGHPSLLRTEQRGDGTWLVEASAPHATVLHSLGILLAASLAGATVAVYPLRTSAGNGSRQQHFASHLVVAAADANPTEACVVVPPTPIGPFDDSSSSDDDDDDVVPAKRREKAREETALREAEALEVLCCDVLASTAAAPASPHAHQALPFALLCAAASRRYHALGPMLEMHQHGLMAQYNAVISEIMGMGGSGGGGWDAPAAIPRSMAAVVAALRSPDASPKSVTAAELALLCQFAASATPPALFEALLAFVPTPSLSLSMAQLRQGAHVPPAAYSVNSTAGAVCVAMVLCSALSAAAHDSFAGGAPKATAANPSAAASSSLSYGIDRLRRYFTVGGVAGPIGAPFAALAAMVITHRYTEYALAAVNNYSAAAQRRHLARDEAAGHAARRVASELAGRLEVALDRALAVTALFAPFVHGRCVAATATTGATSKSPLRRGSDGESEGPTRRSSLKASAALSAAVAASSALEGGQALAALIARFHSEAYLTACRRAVMTSLKACPSALTPAAASLSPPLPSSASPSGAGSPSARAGDADAAGTPIAATALLCYHVLWGAQQQLSRSRAVRHSLALLATALAADKRQRGATMARPSSHAAPSLDDLVHTVIDALDLLMASALQPMLPVEEGLSLLLTAGRLLATRITDAAQRDGADASPSLLSPPLLGAAIVSLRALRVASVERHSSNVAILRDFHGLSSALEALCGEGDGNGGSSSAANGVAMVVMPGEASTGAAGSSAPADSSCKPSAALRAEAMAAAREWAARLSGLVASYAEAREIKSAIGVDGEEKQSTTAPPCLLAAVAGDGATRADLAASVADVFGSAAFAWRQEHSLESRRFLISTGWWRQLPMSVVAWALADQAIGAMGNTTDALPTAAALLPPPLEVPTAFALDPRRSSGQQSAVLDAPLFSLVCSLVPPGRGFARVGGGATCSANVSRISDHAAHHATSPTPAGKSVGFSGPILSATPEPLRRSLLTSSGAGGVGASFDVKVSALSMPSVCVSASTAPSHSPDRHALSRLAGGLALADESVIYGTPMRAGDNNSAAAVGAIDGPEATLRLAAGPSSAGGTLVTAAANGLLALPAEGIESAVYTAQSIAWWEEEAGADANATATTITTMTSGEGSVPRGHADPNAAPLDAMGRLLTEVLAAVEGRNHRRHRSSRCRRHHKSGGGDGAEKGAAAQAAAQVETFVPVPAPQTASGLQPPKLPGQLPAAAGSAAEEAVPLIGLGHQRGPMGAAPKGVRLFDTTDDGRVIPLTEPLQGGAGSCIPAAPSPAFMQAPPPMPPFTLAPPGHLPSHLQGPSQPMPMPGFAGLPPPPQHNGFFMASAGTYTQGGPAGVGAGATEEIVYLRMPPPPPHLKLRLASDANGAQSALGLGGGAPAWPDSPRSDGRVVLGLEAALKAEERLKRKASKRLAKNERRESGEGSSETNSKEKGGKKDKEKGSKKEKEAAKIEPPAPPSHPILHTVTTTAAIANIPSAAHPLSPSEQAQFRKYVDDLLVRNPQPAAAPIDLPDLPPGFSVVPPTSSGAAVASPSSVTKEQSFMERMLTQQRALFEVQQESQRRAQQENAQLLRDLVSDKAAMATSAASPHSLVSHSAAGHGLAGGLSATQQSQLMHQAMDQRDRLLRMNDDILRLQAQNAALAAKADATHSPQFINNGPQVVYVPFPTPGAAATPAVPAAAVAPVATAHPATDAATSPLVAPAPALVVFSGVDTAVQSSPTRTGTAGVNTSNPHALSAGVQAYIASPSPATPARPLHAVRPTAEESAAAAEQLRATMVQMALLTEQLEAANQQSDGIGRTMDEAHRALERSRHMGAVGGAAVEQAAAVAALSAKAAALQSQLSYVQSLPRDAAPQMRAAGPPSTDWDSGGRGPSAVPAVSPLRQSLLGSLGGVGFGRSAMGASPLPLSAASPLHDSSGYAPESAVAPAAAASLHSPPRQPMGSLADAVVGTPRSAPRYPADALAATPHRSIVKSSAAGPLAASMASSPLRAVSFAAASPDVSRSAAAPEAVRRSVTIGRSPSERPQSSHGAAPPDGAVMRGHWEVLGGPQATAPPAHAQPHLSDVHAPHGSVGSPLNTLYAPLRPAPLAERPLNTLFGASSNAAKPLVPHPHRSASVAAPHSHSHHHQHPQQHLHDGPAAPPRRADVVSMGDLIAEAKASARRSYAAEGGGGARRSSAVAKGQPQRSGSAAKPKTSRVADDVRFAMYLQPQQRRVNAQRVDATAVPPVTTTAALLPAAPLASHNAAEASSAAWELREQRRFGHADDIAARQRSLLMDHTAQRIKGLQGLLA